MVTHLSTETIRPLWTLPDDELPADERWRRLTKFSAAKESADRDCTTIVRLCTLWKDKALYAHFAPTWDAFCVEVLKIEPAWVDKVCAGFQLLKAHGEVPANLALTASDRVQQAAVQTTGEVLPRGGDKKSEETKSIGKLPIDEQSHRAQQNGIGERTQRKLDRLARDYPELHAQVTTGELSAHGAAKAAGFIKDTPPLTQLRRSWHKATSDERAIFLAEIREEF